MVSGSLWFVLGCTGLKLINAHVLLNLIPQLCLGFPNIVCDLHQRFLTATPVAHKNPQTVLGWLMS